eukprot:15357626-Ditylum_brightwellii.AAC.1
MEGYFQTTTLVMFNNEMAAFRQEMSCQSESLKISHFLAPPSKMPAGHYTLPLNCTELDMKIEAGAGTQ